MQAVLGGAVAGDGVQALAGDVAKASWQARGAVSRLAGLGDDLGWQSPAAVRFAGRLGVEVRAATEVVTRCEAAQAALQAHAVAVRAG